ncbi:MAG: RES family NAD+ phosphorylase [Acidithiobacillus ferrooxidans]|nr:RES family NAD+ phosphorylase [Acidithiobacillus ferrooxidans]MDD5003911.1 RES family NAD+ phosphorylase [Acidithiobacillus sp.]MDD5378577.1 RES family NAD+ phosphorylase [Acidithiobacillus sp.]MDD5576989.1 RES family NAD+ phosphorylase [Acidithiobacillus sp.]
MESFFAGLQLADTHQTLIRNIATIRVSQDLFDDLSEDPADWGVAQRYEMAAKPHNHISQTTAIDRPFEESEWFNAVEFPFRNWAASRYCDGSFGIWYGADIVETSVYETVYHWQVRLLRDAGFEQLVLGGARERITSERRIYGVRCDAALVDLRPRVAEYPSLVEPDSYHFTQPIGARLKREGHPGLITKSARCDGDVYAVLNAEVLSDARIQSYLTYRLTAQGVRVSRGTDDAWLCVGHRQSAQGVGRRCRRRRGETTQSPGPAGTWDTGVAKSLIRSKGEAARKGRGLLRKLAPDTMKDRQLAEELIAERRNEAEHE